MAMLRRIFGRKEAPQEAQPEIANIQPTPIAAAPIQIIEKKRKRKPKAERRTISRDLSELLDSLEISFDALQLPSETFSHLPASEIKGLKASSPLVSLSPVRSDALTVDRSAGLPFCFVVASPTEQHDVPDGYLSPDFFYATKVKKTPWNVTKVGGDVYRMGLAWRTSEKKHVWGAFWVGVQQDGSVRVAHELHDAKVRVGHGEYARRQWVASSWRTEDKDPITPVINCFCAALQAYQERGSKWNVGVRKGGKRLVFLVDQKDTSAFFRSRDKTALTEGGKRRPIIHYVRPHTQKHGEKIVEIPEHIRGLRSFTWKGYECAITAPQFHVHSAIGLELAGEEYLEDDMPDGTVGLQDIGVKIADLEDYHQKKKKRAA